MEDVVLVLSPIEYKMLRYILDFDMVCETIQENLEDKFITKEDFEAYNRVLTKLNISEIEPYVEVEEEDIKRSSKILRGED